MPDILSSSGRWDNNNQKEEWSTEFNPTTLVSPKIWDAWVNSLMLPTLSESSHTQTRPDNTDNPRVGGH